MVKICKACKEEKTLSEFYVNRVHSKKLGKTIYSSSCKKCESERAKLSNKRNGRSNHLKRRYGIDEEMFDMILREQSWACAICRMHILQSTRIFDVDHCHVTGEVRGVLCGHCNRGLGLFRDNPDVLKRAADYVSS